MNVVDIKKTAKEILLARTVECSGVEYKKSSNFKDKILKTVCAFANNIMRNEINFLFVGVSEDSSQSGGAIPHIPISGIKDAQLESIENEIKSLLSNIQPKVKYYLFDDELDGIKYLVIAVIEKENNSGPYQSIARAENSKDIGLKQGFYVRFGRDSILADRREMIELYTKFARYSFTSDTNEDAKMDDLNYNYMKEYLIATHARKDLQTLDKLGMAKALGLISVINGTQYAIKNFALLMFSDNPSKFIPNANIRTIREVDNTDKMQAFVYEGPIWVQLKSAISDFKNSIMRTYVIRNKTEMEHKIIFNYPLSTIEELISNAVLHNNYENKQLIDIYYYKDRISIVNYNKPLPPVTTREMQENISFDRRYYLNEEIKEMFFALKLIESYGSGIRRAKKELKDNGSPALEVYPENDTEDYTNVVVRIHPEFLKEGVETMQNGSNAATIENSSNYQRKVEKLPEKQEKLPEKSGNTTRETVKEEIIRLIKEYPEITAKEMAIQLHVTEEGIRFHIKNMKKEGILKRIGSTKKGEWEILK